MKKLMMICLFALIAFSSQAQKKTEVKSEVISATVYLSGAEINRRAGVTLTAGNTDVVFTNLPVNLNQQTINVQADGKLIIQSIQFKLNYMQQSEMNAETKKWKDSLDAINLDLEKLSKKKELILMQQSFLEDNKNVSGANTGLNIQAAKDYYAFMTEKEWDLKNQWMDAEHSENKLSEIRNRLTQQLSDFQNKLSQPKGEIWVSVYSENPLSAKFNFDYFVYDAGWTPEYDLRSANVKSNVKLSYKAILWQSTNEDWKDVKLKLSSGNPTLSAVGPVFSAWYLDYYYGMINSLKLQEVTIQGKAPAALEKEFKYDIGDTNKWETGADYTTASNTQLTAEFDISIPYSIPSDGKPHRVNIQDYELPSEYQYYTIPKSDNDVFLNARLTDWGKLNLLPGTANIFFEGAYVGQSFIDPNNTQDTLDISLGRDKKIIVKREKVKDFTKSRIIGTNYKQTVAYEISVKNTKAEPVTIKVIEQYPISGNSEIEVTLEDAGGATVETETGKLTWMLNLPGSGEQKLRYSFSVKFPEKKRNTVYAPRF